MSNPFAAAPLAGVTLANRFVRSATWAGMATDSGAATAALTAKLAELAAGKVGLILTGHAYVAPAGQAGPWQLGAYSEDLLTGLEQMTAAVHAAGGRIFLQLAHAGAHAATQLSGLSAWGPSPMEGRHGGVCREMTPADIAQVVAALARAARLARKAGFDGVQVHAAHGYLLSQFLAPASNRRTDAYGGSAERRARIVREAVAAVRAAVGDDYPVIIKVNCDDFADTGWDVDALLDLARRLDGDGLDAFEMSGGRVVNPPRTRSSRIVHPKSPSQEAYYRDAARRFKQAVDAPLILVGGIRSIETSEALLAEGTADFIALSRPLIAEPALVARWQAGDRRPAVCISCNECYKPLLAGEGLTCPTVARRNAEERRAKPPAA